MSQNRNRRLAIDLIPCMLMIGFGIIEPMYGFLIVPAGVVLLIWAAIRFARTATRSSIESSVQRGREFFKGEQRQAGLVTLGMALALTLIWIRSYSVADIIRFVGKTETQKLLISINGQAVWEPFPKRPVNRVPVLVSLDRALPEIDHLLHSMREDHHISRWIIPYWSLVLPLTLLSAWLLLTKPRPPNSSKESNRA